MRTFQKNRNYLWLVILAVIVCAGCKSSNNTKSVDLKVSSLRDQRFDNEWKFFRGEADNAQLPKFDDTNWRMLDLPHDWSIEDLPNDSSVLNRFCVTEGEWLFNKGDNSKWKEESIDDKDWNKVMLPAHWKDHSNLKDKKAYGWYRKNLIIPENLKGKDFMLDIGRIDDVDETFLNGVRLGGKGKFPPEFGSAKYDIRCYRVAAKLLKGDGTDLVAVRVYDEDGDGGIYNAGYSASVIGPFSPESLGGSSTGYVVGGTGWYRKAFKISEEDKDKIVSVIFDGVYMDATVWLNGDSLGRNPYGYTAFSFDLTKHLRPAGEINVLAVRVNNEGTNSRWYSGSGIYRHVSLRMTNAVHIPIWGTSITTPEVSDEKASIQIAVDLRNTGDVPVVAEINMELHDPAGNKIATLRKKQSIAVNQEISITQDTVIQAPQLWSLDSPNLYNAQTSVMVNGELADQATTSFGIRSIELSAKDGFKLNGKSLKLKGGCFHHDNGPLGSAAYDRAEERKVELLKANGYNALRTSHNPPSTVFLEACDRLGLLLMDESFDHWEGGKNNFDYHRFFKDWWKKDLTSMIMRDRNHPSVIIWSIGNEIMERGTEQGVATTKMLYMEAKKLDPTRPVTEAICKFWDTRDWKLMQDNLNILDIAGYNYEWQRYEEDHKSYPDRIIIATESIAKEAFDNWEQVEKHPYVIGDFVWTCMDHIGESALGNAVLDNNINVAQTWPWHLNNSGDLDLCGFKKPQSYYRDVVWNQSSLEMAVHAPIPEGAKEIISMWGWPNELQSWTWPGEEGKPLQVKVYSRYESVRLELNGKIIETKPVEKSNLTANFSVPYVAGELKAIGISEGKEKATLSFQTIGAPARLRLTPDRARISTDRNDLSYITVDVLDKEGHIAINAEVKINFTISEAGKLAGIANGNPQDMASFQQPKCNTFKGKALLIVRSNGDEGKIQIDAVAEGLEPARASIETFTTKTSK